MLCIVGELARGGSVLWLLALVTCDRRQGRRGRGLEGEEEMGQDEGEESPAQMLSG